MQDSQARRIRTAAHTAGTCLTPGEQMRVRARFLDVGKVEPQASVLAPPLEEPEPYVYTDLSAWNDRVAAVAKLPEAPFRMYSRGGVNYLVPAKHTPPPPGRITRWFTARAPRRQTHANRTRTTRGSPTSAAGSSRADDDPPGLRVGPGSWLPASEVEPPADVTTPAKAVTS